MPDRWPRKFSAARSAERTARASPSIVISAVFAATAAPSRVMRRDRRFRDRACAARLRPAAGRRSCRPCARPRRRAPRVPSGHGRGRGDVAGAAEILGERARHRGIDLERREEGVGAEQGGHATRSSASGQFARRAAIARASIERDEGALRLRGIGIRIVGAEVPAAAFGALPAPRRRSAARRSPCCAAAARARIRAPCGRFRRARGPGRAPSRTTPTCADISWRKALLAFGCDRRLSVAAGGASGNAARLRRRRGLPMSSAMRAA